MAYETTDAWAYLNIFDPICAWMVYRAFIPTSFDSMGFVSARATGALRKYRELWALERALELHRAARYPYKVSRLSGFYCFPDPDSATMADTWGLPYVRPELLVELSLEEAGPERDRLDSNWITYHREAQVPPGEWMEKYWSGEPYPGRRPIWECIVTGKVVILGTDLRMRALDLIDKHAPDTVTLLEISRVAALVGSDLGSIASFARIDGSDLVVEYCMNMVDVANPDFLARLDAFLKSGELIYRDLLMRNLPKGHFGPTLDLTKRFFRVNLDEYRAINRESINPG